MRPTRDDVKWALVGAALMAVVLGGRCWLMGDYEPRTWRLDLAAWAAPQELQRIEGVEL